jgi:hypothetical protein
MKLPEDFVTEKLKKAKGCTFFGVPVEQLSKEELIAVAVTGWRAWEKAVDENQRDRDFFFEMGQISSSAKRREFLRGRH